MNNGEWKEVFESEAWAKLRECFLNNLTDLYLRYPSFEANDSIQKAKCDAQIALYKYILNLPMAFESKGVTIKEILQVLEVKI